jgi:hypothetical protein
VLHCRELTVRAMKTLAMQRAALLLDDLVSAGQENQREGDAENLGGR